MDADDLVLKDADDLVLKDADDLVLKHQGISRPQSGVPIHVFSCLWVKSPLLKGFVVTIHHSTCELEVPFDWMNCVHEPECFGTTKPNRLILITITM